MDVREETGGVLLDLLDVEALGGVVAIIILDTSLEGATNAADAVAAAIIHLHGVGESDAEDMLALCSQIQGSKESCAYRGGPAMPTAAS